MEIKIFEKDNPVNACIVCVDNYTTAEIKRLLKLQTIFGRDEIEFMPDREGGAS